MTNKQWLAKQIFELTYEELAEGLIEENFSTKTYETRLPIDVFTDKDWIEWASVYNAIDESKGFDKESDVGYQNVLAFNLRWLKKTH